MKALFQGQLAEVVVYCAVPDGSQAGQIEIFEEVSKNYQKPKRVISLAEVIPPGVQQGSPCVSLSCSPGAHSPRNSSYLATSPSLNGQTLYPFQMVLRNGEVIEFFAETAEDQRQWMKRLGLLLMFPYSPIPEEPPVDPIKESMKAKLNSKDYNAGEIIHSLLSHDHLMLGMCLSPYLRVIRISSIGSCPHLVPPASCLCRCFICDYLMLCRL